MELQENYAQIKAIGAEVIAISIDDELDAGRMVELYGIEFPILHDSSADVARSWEIYDLLNDGVSAPAAYVFDASGELFAYRVAEDISDRPTAAELLATLAAT